MDYKEAIIKMVQEIENQKILKRIYNLVHYLYVHE